MTIWIMEKMDLAGMYTIPKYGAMLTLFLSPVDGWDGTIQTQGMSKEEMDTLSTKLEEVRQNANKWIDLKYSTADPWNSDIVTLM